MMRRLSLSYKKHWDQLTERYGRLCYYCQEEVATTIDHVVPYAYDQDNTIENLVPSCALCNSLASDKHFDDVDHKKQYVLGKRKNRNLRRAICVDCLIPFAYREHSPSLLLCAECYDKEYGTRYSKSVGWVRWIIELEAAGTYIEAHKFALLKAGRHTDKNHQYFIAKLLQYYIDHDQHILREREYFYQTHPKPVISIRQIPQRIYKTAIRPPHRWLQT